MAILSTLATIAPYHVLAYSLVYGTTAFQSFFNGIVAFKALPYEHFSALQSNIFPTYFAFQTATSLILLLTPPVPFLGGLALAKNIALGSSLVSAAGNMLYLGPKSRVVMAQRREQIAIEGKSHKDPTASETMKAINKRFGTIHGASVVLNLITFVGLTAYGIIMTDGFLAKAIRK